MKIYWLRSPSQPETPFLVVFLGVYSANLSSCLFAGCCLPETGLTLIHNSLPVSFCNLWPRSEAFPCSQDIRRSLLDVLGEETYEGPFLHVSQRLMLCGGVSVSGCPSPCSGCWWPWSETSPVFLGITGDQRYECLEGFTGEERPDPCRVTG